MRQPVYWLCMFLDKGPDCSTGTTCRHAYGYQRPCTSEDKLIMANLIRRGATLVLLMAGLSLVSACVDSSRPEGVTGQSHERIENRNDAFRVVLDYLDGNRLGRVLSVEYDDEEKTYAVSTYTTESVGFLSGGGYKLVLRVERSGPVIKVVELSRISWVS